MSSLRPIPTNPATLATVQEAEIRRAYERLIADLKRNFPGVQGEYFPPPTYQEFKEAYSHD